MTNCKIVIVEDDPMISEIYQKKFAESGFEVLAAETGEQVLTIIKKEKIDLVLLDLLMPKMNGFEVIENLRSDGRNSDVKIVVFSNLSSREDKDKATKLGANGFIQKSDYTPTNLVKEVRRLLNQWKESRKNEARYSGANRNGFEKSGKKILMIEDEVVFTEMFGEKLRQEGFEVDFSYNGNLGLEKAQSEKYDLLIIDIVLPGMDGDEIIEKLKGMEKTKDIPIIAFSASVDTDVMKKVMNLGASEFFVKTQIITSELANKAIELLNL